MRVDAVPLEALEVISIDCLEARVGIALDVTPDVKAILLTFDALGLVLCHSRLR